MTAQFPTGKVTVEVSRVLLDRADYAMRQSMSRVCNCPVALALAYAGFVNVAVTNCTFTAGPISEAGGKRRRYDLPAKAQEFIQNYDSPMPGLATDPITFVVDADFYRESNVGAYRLSVEADLYAS